MIESGQILDYGGKTMVRYIFEQSDEIITTFNGLSAVGQLLDKTSLTKRLNKVIVHRSDFCLSWEDQAECR